MVQIPMQVVVENMSMYTFNTGNTCPNENKKSEMHLVTSKC
jgi:hypothetical protein